MKRKKSGSHRTGWDFEIKFWKDWLYADPLKRIKLVEKLSLLRDADDLKKIAPERRKHMFAMFLNSFFEDLESAVYTKVRLDNKAKKR